MELKDVVAIAGVSGLHKIIGKTKSGLILETIGTAKRFPTGVHDKVSVLEDISMYTHDGDMKLNTVFVSINNKEKAGEKVPEAKTDMKVLRSFLTDTIKIDNERVYDSDIKKLLNWYHLLKSDLDFVAMAVEPVAEEASEKDAETVVDSEEKVKPKATPKAPKNVAPKNMTAKANKGAAGAKMTYRPKSGT